MFSKLTYKLVPDRDFLDKKLFSFLNRVVILGLLILPYWLFEGKLFIGGDDSRLFYVFPKLWIQNLAWFSWFNLSSVGQHNPQQFMLPLLTVLSVFKKILPELVVANLAFSVPLLLGFIFFQKMFQILIGEKSSSIASRIASFFGACFFVFSPILWIITISPFLYAVWLIALLPMLSFYFIKYVQTGRLLYVFLSCVACILLSLAIFSLPWLFGFMIPVLVSLAICAWLYETKLVVVFLQRSLILLLAILFTQCFWVLPFIMSAFDKSGSFIGTALSAGVQDTFTTTIIATMFKNNIFFPILNLFHRSIVFENDWQAKSSFEFIYDNFFWLNLIFIFVVIAAVAIQRRFLNKSEKKTFYILLSSWLVALFVFTVNIGVLKNFFLSFGAIPGFVMFRNAFDKFAIGYVLLYALVFSYSFWILLQSPFLRHSIFKSALLATVVLALIVEALPFKGIINKNLWSTVSIKTVINIPKEYSDFTSVIAAKTSPTTNILSLPFGYPAYTIIKDKDSRDIFAGTSPIKILTGRNDFSGFLSFSGLDGENFAQALLKLNRQDVENFLQNHNIGYVFITKNIPSEVMTSYIFSNYPRLREINKKIYNWFLPLFLGERLAVSSNAAYELFSTKVNSSILDSPGLTFRKVSPVKYQILIRNLTQSRTLKFKDTFSFGWKLYLEDKNDLNNCEAGKYIGPSGVKECEAFQHLFDWNDLKYFWQQALPVENSPGPMALSNNWEIDPKLIEKFSKEKSQNNTSDVSLSLYFYPQLYFYAGILISLLSLCLLVTLAFLQIRRSHDSSSDSAIGRLTDQ